MTPQSLISHTHAMVSLQKIDIANDDMITVNGDDIKVTDGT
jgi:hypothetical protein